MKDNFGEHLILDFATTDVHLLEDTSFFRSFTMNLIDNIGMELHYIDGVPALQVDAWGDGTLYGTSVTAMITTSSITIHSSMKDNKMIVFLDIFTCRAVSYDDVKKIVESRFKDVEVKRWLHLER